MGELHCLNVGCGDATVIKTDNHTFLVDCHGIESYTHLLPTNKQLRGVFITHQHSDHYSGLGYLKDNGYSIGCLIYSPYDRRHNDSSVTWDEWKEFEAYKDYFVGQGTKPYAPFRQTDWSKAWWDIDGIQYWIIGPHESVAKSDTRKLHDGCLVIHARLGKRVCLFAGDASDANLEYIANKTTNLCGDILHASHHGSIEGANLEFVKKCGVQYTLISTASDKYESVPHPTALSRYKEHTAQNVIRTDVVGTWKWTF
jgi:beta-lactamase superfamily II metal-dependent hydrolase